LIHIKAGQQRFALASRRKEIAMTTSHLVGHLHGPGGSWRFHYDIAGSTPDETGSHFDDERFEPGEYVSVHEADGINVYRIVSVLPL
jgi:hypothetical protein